MSLSLRKTKAKDENGMQRNGETGSFNCATKKSVSQLGPEV